MKKLPNYECLNVAGEVVFVGNASEVLEYYEYEENCKIVNVIREEGKENGFVADLWVPLAKIIRGVIKSERIKRKKRRSRKMQDVQKELLEKAVGTVSLLRRSGSFIDNNGEKVEYSKLILNVNGADIDPEFDKNIKNVLSALLKFEKVAL